MTFEQEISVLAMGIDRYVGKISPGQYNSLSQEYTYCVLRLAKRSEWLDRAESKDENRQVTKRQIKWSLRSHGEDFGYILNEREGTGGF